MLLLLVLLLIDWLENKEFELTVFVFILLLIGFPKSELGLFSEIQKRLPWYLLLFKYEILFENKDNTLL